MRKVIILANHDHGGVHAMQYLLAPMQDGSFQDGQLTHPIGKSIFIFAGGTSSSFQTFGPPNPGNLKREPTPQEEEAYDQFKFAKGPDFQSRLDGFINVNGPDKRVLPNKRNKKDLDPCDIFFPLRRAFLIRGEFRLKPEKKLDVDDGLLEALVRADGYQLELMAENEHDRWMGWHLSQGWRWGEKKDPAKLTEEPKLKTHPCLKPYSELSDEERNKDRNTIRHYLEFAEKAGMKIVPLQRRPMPAKKRAAATPARRKKP